MQTQNSICPIDLKAIEAALLRHPSVEDCVVLVREVEPVGPRLVAYVVSSGPFVAERLHAALQAVLPGDVLPHAYVPISALPLTPSGQVDEQALSQLAVIDADLVQRCQEHFQALPEVAQAAVVVQEHSEPILPLHLSELVPAWKGPSASRADEPTPVIAHTPVPQEEAVCKPLAISSGEPLRTVQGAPTTLPEALDRAARESPHKGITYIQADGSDIFQSYDALRDEAERILAGLRRLGLRPGDKVLFQLDLNQDFIPAFWGCVLGGFVPVPVSIPSTYDEINTNISKLHNAWQMLDRPTVLASGGLAPAVRSVSSLLRLDNFRVEILDELRACDPDRDWHVSQPDDLALLLLTSGSTGKPKAVMHCHRSLRCRSAGTAQLNGFSSRDVSLNWFPLDHVGALVMFHFRDLFLGCQQIQVPTQLILRDPLKWLDLIDRYHATVTWAPNFAYGLVNAHAEEIGRRHWDLQSMRFILNAGEAIVAKTARRFLELLAPHGLPATAMHPAWGMSETCSAVAYSDRFSLFATVDDDSFVEVGAPIPEFSMRIVDDQDQVLAEEKIGRLQVQGPTVTSGYYQNPELNKEAFTQDGWYNTGDLGLLRQGRLTITGRQKDVIIINGVNYYSHEFEALVEEIPGVEVSYTAACAVREAGSNTDSLAIFFHSPASQADQLAQLIKEIRGRVVRSVGVNPAYLIPVAKEAVPKTEIGKIQRAQLKKRFEAGEFDAILQQIDIQSGNANTLPDWFFRTIWRPKEARSLISPPLKGPTLVFLDPLGLGRAVCAALTQRDHLCVSVEPGPSFAKLGPHHYRINPREAEHYRRLVKSLSENNLHINQILHLWTYDRYGAEVSSTAALQQAQDRGVYSLLFLVQSLTQLQGAERPVCLLAISSHTQAASPDDDIAYERSPVLGLIRTIPTEMPNLDCRHIDLPVERSEVNAARIVAELGSRGDREVAYRNGQRLVPRLERVDLRHEEEHELPFKAGGTYLLSGGLGGIGVEVGKYLLEHYQARLLLVGRSPLPERDTWEAHLRQNDEVSRRIQAYQSLACLGGEVFYEAADICDLEQLQHVVERARSRWQCDLDGVIHLAGTYHDRLLTDESRDSFESVLRPKVLGTWALHQLIKDRPNSLFLSFSSAIAFFGGALVGAYATANHFLDVFADFQRRRCSLRSHCFAWGTWNEIGMSRGYQGKNALRSRGIQELSAEQGIYSLLAALHRGRTQLLVGLDGSNSQIRRHLESKSYRAQQLTAYVTAQAGAPSSTRWQGLEARDQFGTRCSCEVRQVAEMPLTEAGTIDRQRLADAGRRAPGGSERVAPRTEEERHVADIWRQVLGVPQVGIQDNFFELGGHSLLATRVISQLRETLQIELPLRALFEAPTIAALVEKIRAVRPSAHVPQAPPLRPSPRDVPLPLSFAQQRLWFIDQLEPGGSSYNTPCAFRLAGALDVAALEQSLNEIVRRHEALRTSFPSVSGRPVQSIACAQPWNLPVVDIGHLPEAEREVEAMRRANAEAQRPFDLARGPLFRTTLLRLGERDHLLLVTLHHIVSDGWSLGVFNKELAALYEAFSAGKPSPLPELPIQYADYAVWQRHWLQGEVLETQLSYWQEQLAGAPRLLELPTDRPRPPLQSYRGARQSFVLAKGLSERLEALSRKEGVTLFMTLIAAFQSLLGRYTGQEQIVVSTAVANRHRRETESLIGCLINVLLLRADLSGNPSFRDLLAQVREAALGVYAHQDMPFEQLVEVLEPERDLSFNPLTQVMFVLLNSSMDDLQLPGLRVTPVDVESAATQYDIVVHMVETADGLTGFVDYSTDLFDGSTIQRMLGHFQTFLESVVAAPEQRLADLRLLTTAEQRQILVDWNDTRTDFPHDKCVHELFELQVERSPDAAAVIYGEERLTYGELNRRANQLGRYLRKLGVGPDVLVGLCVERSLEMLVGLLGIMKAGGAYVPLDPAYPKERLAFMLEDAQVRVLLTQQRLAPLWHGLETMPQRGHKCAVVCLDSNGEMLAQESVENLSSSTRPEDLVYVIYTSGSTGKPKGVQIPHTAMVNFLHCMRRRPGLTDQDTLLAVTTLSFDIAGLELFLPLTVGARVVLVSREVAADGAQLAEQLTRSAATVMQATPTTWRLLLEAGWKGIPHLKILCGGEALPRALASQLLDKCSSFWNMYGPTETTIWSAVCQVDSSVGPIFIGRPIANTQLYVLDRHLRPVPVGVPGELHIGGAGLARGYLNRPELTAEKFIADPFCDDSQARLYKTGDLVRYRPAGNLEFLGRIDHQVKVRGQRIELGEIEAVLGSHAGVRDAVVLAREDVPGEKRLVAYVVCGPQPAPTTSELHRFLREKLPDNMVPSAFVKLAALPLTANGKVDRKALAAPAQDRPELAEAYVAPRTPDEEMLAGIWSRILGADEVGIHDNFFERGGHSLLATQLISQVREVFQVEVPLRNLFETPTVAGLAQSIQVVRRLEQGPQTPPLRPIPRNGELPLSFAQQRFWFIDQLAPGNSSYNLSSAFRLTGTLHVEALQRSLSEIVRRHEALRTTFPAVAGKPLQLIAPAAAWSLPLVDIRHLPEAEREAEARRLANAEAQRPFDLARGPLLRTTLLRLGERDHMLLLTMHHIVSDGWSLGVFSKELATLYQAFSDHQPSSLPELPIQYVDYAVWQRNWLQGEVLEKQLSYWKQQLEGAPRLLELPADRPRPPVQTFRGARQAFVLSKELTEQLKALSRKEGVTLFMTLMAAFQTLLCRYSGQEQFIVSTGVANRDRPETEALIGCLINILLLRADLFGNPSFRDFLGRVREVALAAYAHQQTPFEQLVEELQPERDLSYNPLTQVMFVLLNAPMDHLELPGLGLRPVEVETPASPYDVVMHMWETADGLTGFWHYSTDLFDGTTIARMLGHFQKLLQSIVAEPDQRVLDLPLLTEAEQHQMLVGWNDTKTAFPQDKCLHELFELQAAKAPDAVAVIFGDERLTYAELDRRANQLGHYLQKLGVGPDVLVGLCVERSLEMVVGILGIMKAGGAYVPLDPTYPQERLRFMLNDTSAAVLLTQERLLASLAEVPTRVVCLDSAWNEIAQESGQKPAGGAGPQNLSYVIYTSGSTGTPKGIAIQHRGVLNNILDLNGRHGIGPQDRMLALSSLSFDMCVYEVFGTLAAGGTIVMPLPAALREPAQWAELMRQHRITVWNSAPALLKMLVDYAVDRPELWPRHLHLAILGGDWVPVNLPDRLKAMAPQVRVIVLGGATEASIHSIIYPVDKTDPTWKSIPYGRPQYNQKAYILNPRLQPAPIGVAGELYLGGIGLGRGYFNRPQQTAERFLPNPFATEPGERIYKTGDLARYWPDGNIELLGRMDYQVKLRGLRIECGEIEAVLRQHPGVREAVVAAKEQSSGDKRLVAYVRPNQQTALPVCQLLSYERKGLLNGWRRGELPNGMAVVYRNKAETEFGYKEIFEEQGYLRHGIRLQDGDCIFDVGANIGMFALHVGQVCQQAQIYCFEPIPPVYELLQLNTALYGLNVKLFNFGLSRDSQSETLTYYPHLSLISGRFADGAAERETVKSFLRNDQQAAANEKLLDELLAERLQSETITCEMRTISQVIREHDIDHIDLLKIDVEKSELDVLAGIEAPDWKKIRQLVVEVYDSEGRVARITDMLQNQGYSVAAEQDVILQDTPYRNVYAVRTTAVRCQGDENGSRTDRAGKTSWSSPERLVEDIRNLIKTKLPDYMVPSALVLMDELPLSPNGKIDRKALPAPADVRPKSEETFLKPRTPAEETLAGIYAKVLGVESVSVLANFFDLGGHSLLATQVISQVREAFQVELPLRALFESPTVAGLAERIVATRQSGKDLQVPALTPVARSGPLPLSFAQQRLWFIDQLLPGTPSYNIPLAFRLAGVLQEGALQRSLGEIIRRHEALRTTFPLVDGQPVQQIAVAEEYHLPVIDLRYLAEPEREVETDRLVNAEAQRPFDLARGPLLRTSLLRLREQDHLLLVTMHHIVADGWSLAVFTRELAALYEAYSAGQPSPLAELPIQYADYATWQRSWLQGEVLEEQVAYWKRQLAGAPPKLELPTDHPRPAVQTLRGARYYFSLPACLAEAAEAMSRQQGTTLFMTLLAAFETFLHAYTEQEDLVVGSPFANRTRAETEGLMGPFVNTLVLRTQLAANPTFGELLSRVRDVILEADAHQDLPFEKIVEAVRPVRDPSSNPLFQVNFRVLTAPQLLLKLPGLTTNLQLSHCQNSKFDLALELWVSGEKFAGYFEYSTDLFEEATIRRMCGELEEVLSTVLQRPDTRLNDLEIVQAIRTRCRPHAKTPPADGEQPMRKGLRNIRRKLVDP